MTARAKFLAAMLGVSAVAADGQILSATVDILSPGDPGYDGIPANLLVLDIFVDVAQTDAWTAAGTIMYTHHSAVLRYFDLELNRPGLQPGLVNPGTGNRFVTCLSKPRGRNGNARFENAGAAAAGGGPFDDYITQPDILSVAYFASPPESSESPSVDGYIARIAVDLSVTPYRPDDLIVTYTRPDFFIFECDRISAAPGFVWATFDEPALDGMDFWVTVPEPAGAFGAVLLMMVGRRAVRTSCHRLHR